MSLISKTEFESSKLYQQFNGDYNAYLAAIKQQEQPNTVWQNNNEAVVPQDAEENIYSALGVNFSNTIQAEPTVAENNAVLQAKPNVNIEAEAEDDSDDWGETKTKTVKLNENANNKVERNESKNSSIETYQTELAKNKFLYGDPNNIKDENAWNKLSDDERNQLIDAAKAEANISEDVDEGLMNIKAANTAGKSLPEFMAMVNSKDPHVAAEADVLYYESLYSLVNGDHRDVSDESLSQMNDAQKNKWRAIREVCDDANFEYRRLEAEKLGKSIDEIEDVNYCPDEAYKFYDRADIKDKTDPFKARIGRLEYKADKLFEEKYGKLPESDEDKELAKSLLTKRDKVQLDGIKQLYTSKTGKRFIDSGEVDLRHCRENLVEKNMRIGKYETVTELIDADLQKIHNDKSLSRKEKIEQSHDLMGTYYLSVVANDPERAEEVHNYMMKMKEHRQKSIQSDHLADQYRVSTHMHQFDDSETCDIYCRRKDDQAFMLTAENNIDIGRQANAHNEAAHESINLEINKSAVRVQNKYSHCQEYKQEVYEEMMQRTEKASDETKIYYFEQSGDIAEKAQLIGREPVLNSTSNKDVHVAAKDSVSKLAENNQTPAFTMGTKAAQNCLAEKDAIEVLKGYADVIQDCSAKNQLDMHKDISQSKYAEVVEHAANNISKYDAKVQAEAVKATIYTGNEKAIEAAVAQVNTQKIDASVAKDPVIAAQIAKVEQKYILELAKKVSDFNSEVDKVSGNNSKTREEYIKEFTKASPQEQYRMLAKLPDSLKKEAFAMMAKYNPSMLKNFVLYGNGAQILHIPGLPADVVNMVVNIMLNDNNIKNQQIAAEFIKKSPSRFRESTYERAVTILDSNKTDSNTVNDSNTANVNKAEFVKHSAPKEFAQNSLLKKSRFNGIFV